MNKRQRKKAFKRKYGYNPPSVKKQLEWCKILEKSINKFKEVIIKISSNINAKINEATTTIREMPAIEFEKKIGKSGSGTSCTCKANQNKDSRTQAREE